MKHYFDGIAGKRVLIVGMVPPPFGGIAVHVSRKIAALKRAGNQVFAIDICKEYARRSKIGYAWFLVRTVIYFRPHHVYYHGLLVRKNVGELFLLGVVTKFFCSRLHIVEHSDRAINTRSSWFVYSLNILIRLLVDQQILIGLNTVRAYRDRGIVVTQRLVVARAFIEPNFSQESAIIAAYPADVIRFIETKRIALLVNASSFVTYQGVDVYGIDLCIRLLRDLPADVGMVIAVGTVTNRPYHDAMMAQLNELSGRVFVLLNCQVELWPLMRLVDIFLRPTRYDTDGISVYEALLVKTPVVASNVTVRPAGCITFDVKNYDEFFSKTAQLLHAL